MSFNFSAFCQASSSLVEPREDFAEGNKGLNSNHKVDLHEDYQRFII